MLGGAFSAYKSILRNTLLSMDPHLLFLKISLRYPIYYV